MNERLDESHCQAHRLEIDSISKTEINPTSAARNSKKRKKTQRHLDKRAQEKNIMVIAGHTHRPILPPGESLYLNDGSCVHPSIGNSTLDIP